MLHFSRLKLHKNQNIKVGILGGSFDPAHFGHIYIASKALELLNLDEVWFTVAAQNPWKPLHKYSVEDRILKLNNLICDNNKFKILDIEKELHIKYTADLFEILRDEAPIIDFIFIAGADIAINIDKWEKFNSLIKLTDIAIFSRGGYNEINSDTAIFKKYNNKIKFFEIDEVEISSTKIRQEEK